MDNTDNKKEIKKFRHEKTNKYGNANTKKGIEDCNFNLGNLQ